MEGLFAEDSIYNKEDSVKRWPTLLGVNIVYMLALLLMVLAPFVAIKWMPSTSGAIEYYVKLFFLQLFLVGGPPLAYMFVRKMDIRKVVRWNPIKIGEVLLVLSMAIFGYGVILIINLIWFWVASHWGTPAGQALPPITNGGEFLAAVLVIGVMPAVVEEFLFRGLILRGYERLGGKTAIIMTGVLFGMLHLQLMSIPSIILLGIMISYVVYRTDSIFAGMIYHFTHNAVTVAFVFLQNLIAEQMDITETIPQDLTQMPKEALIGAFVVWGIVGFIALILFACCFGFFHHYTKGKGQVRDISTRERGRAIWIEMLPGILAMVLVILGVVMEVLQMMSLI